MGRVKAKIINWSIAILNRLWLMLAALIIFTAVLISLLRALLPTVDVFQPDLEAYLSEKLDAQVSFGSISAEWIDYGPRVAFTDLNITERETQASSVQVAEAEIKINFWRSLFGLTLTTDRVLLRHSRFVIDREQWTDDAVVDNNQPTGYSSFDFLVDVFFGQNDVSIEDVTAVFVNLDDESTELTLANLTIANYGDIHQLEGLVQQSDGGQLDLVAEFYGDPRISDARILLQLDSRDIDVTSLPWLVSVAKPSLQTATLNGRIAAEYSSGMWQYAQADINLSNIELELKQQRFFYQTLNTQVDWQPINESTSRAVLSELSAVDQQDKLISLGGLTLTFLNGEQPQIDISYKKVSPGKLNNIWSLFITDPDLQVEFLEANPQLTINQLLVELRQIDEKWQLNSGYLDISDVQFNKTASTPALPELKGELWYQNETLSYSLESAAGEFEYQPMFRYPIPINKFVLQGKLHNFSEGSLLQFDHIALSSDALQLSAAGNLYLHDTGPPELSVYAELINADVAKTPLFLPVTEMEPALIDYLDTAPQNGTVSYARFNMQGRLVSKMLRQPDTVFDIFAEVDNFDFQYQPEFPKLDELDIELRFTQNSMKARTRKGRYKNLTINKAIGRIDDFSAPGPVLQLELEATTDHASADQLVDTSRLKRVLGNVLKGIKPQGKFGVTTELKVSLSDVDNFQLNGAVNLNATPVDLSAIDLFINGVTGSVKFNQSGVFSEPIIADVLGGKTQLELATKDIDSSQYLTMTLQGNANISQVTKWLMPGSQFPVSESTDILGEGRICIARCQETAIEIEITSDLSSSVIDFPEPFSKTQDEKWPTRVIFKQSSEQQTIDIAISDFLMGEFHYPKSASGYDLARVNFAIDQPGLGETKVLAEDRQNGTLRIHSKVNRLELFDWVEAVAQTFGSLDGKEDSNGLDFSAQFDVQTLLLSDVPLTNFSSVMNRSKEGDYLFNVESAETKGSVVFSPNTESGAAKPNVSIELDALDLPVEILEELEQSKQLNNAQSVQQKVANFTKWPMIKFNCKVCNIFGIYLGTLDANVTPDTNHLVISSQAYEGKYLQGDLQMDWRVDSQIQHTRARLRLESNSIGKLLRRWKIPVGIQDSSGYLSLALDWSGAPYQFALANSSGGASVRLTSGYLEEVSDARARLVSLFSITSIARRLSLDFKDIYKKGFFYQSMQGDFAVSNGVVTTEGFFVNGNAADVLLSGRVNLVNETIDQYAAITPKVTSSLPVLAGWAVEPSTGVIVWLLSKLFEPAIDVITNIKYRLVGNWQQPEVIELDKSTRELKLTEQQLEAIRQAQKSEDEIPEEQSQPTGDENDNENEEDKEVEQATSFENLNTLSTFWFQRPVVYL